MSSLNFRYTSRLRRNLSCSIEILQCFTRWFPQAVLDNMDTTAYLTRQGWRGAGNSLHPSGHGIKKPLLVSKKSNVLGIGKKQHDAHADQWWARAFDATLKDLNVSKDDSSGKAEKVTFGAGAKQLEMVGRMGGKWATNGGLYGAFVRGQALEGTISPKGMEGRESDKAEHVGGKRIRSKEEREERKRRRKQKTFKGVRPQALEVTPVIMPTKIVVDNEVREAYPRKRAIHSEDVEKRADKKAKKLSKDGRRKSRKDSYLQAAGDLKLPI